MDDMSMTTSSCGDKLEGEGVALDEFDKDEWRDVARLLDRNYSDEKFDADWSEFVAMKQRRKAN